jgi:hypothetical protein
MSGTSHHGDGWLTVKPNDYDLAVVQTAAVDYASTGWRESKR